VITSREALGAAASVLTRLTRSRDESTNWSTELTVYQGNADGDDCYRVVSLNTNSPRGYDAAVEVDRRSGAIVLVDLFAKRFFDYDFALQISNKVYVPDRANETRTSTPAEAFSPGPGVATNMVADAVASWIWLCNRLGVVPGPQTNLDCVHWGETFVYTNSDISTSAPVLQVRFKNGVCFESCGGVTFSHYAADACFTGLWRRQPPEYFKPFEGTVSVTWKDLSTNLEGMLRNRLGIPAELLARFTADGKWKPPELGTRTTKRLVVEWRHWPRTEGFVPIQESILAFAAEFDLENGELKWINFQDPEFIAAIGLRQGRSERSLFQPH